MEKLSLYGGDYLWGLYVSEAVSELEHWIDREVWRLRDLPWRGYSFLSLIASPGGEVTRAVKASRRL